MTLSPTVVWDLDGVLADVRHRLHFVVRRPKDWDGFFAAAVDDPLLPAGAALLREQADAGHTVLYLSGRPERCRRDTEQWLTGHALPRGAVHLRPDHDRRPARAFKLDVVRRLGEQHHLVQIVDDDPAVVAALTEAGFPARHARWMHEDTDTLWQIQEVEGRS